MLLTAFLLALTAGGIPAFSAPMRRLPHEIYDLSYPDGWADTKLWMDAIPRIQAFLKSPSVDADIKEDVKDKTQNFVNLVNEAAEAKDYSDGTWIQKYTTAVEHFSRMDTDRQWLSHGSLARSQQEIWVDIETVEWMNLMVRAKKYDINHWGADPRAPPIKSVLNKFLEVGQTMMNEHPESFSSKPTVLYDTKNPRGNSVDVSRGKWFNGPREEQLRKILSTFKELKPEEFLELDGIKEKFLSLLPTTTGTSAL
ncbi:hypothetical protein FRB94_009302 [Tulasnella sp. JGI-2019a]|nr:hypothetical protein FRB93_008176 [Tulasnella sp. JGI-2019a]KAG8995308.1 hypothetical protein FRB94_009302 [Tulasnella sp. JGI-2019a]KAG9027087.1 hypothetical protein FRB95_008135 [Tulasnella sp. JGI-2019a]